MADYLPLIIGFLLTLVGIVGNTWNKKKFGIRRITRTGWTVGVLAVASLLLGVVKVNHLQREKVSVLQLQSLARHQAMDGLSHMLRHLVLHRSEEQGPNTVLLPKSNDEVLRELSDPAHLYELGRTRVVRSVPGTVLDGMGPSGGGFDQPWKLYSYNIRRGEGLLNDVLLKYSSFLSPKLLVCIDDVLRDSFFLDRFSLEGSRLTLDLAEHEQRLGQDSGWAPLGLYYFNIVYEGATKRDGEYGAFLSFIGKVRALVEAINAEEDIPIFYRSYQ